MSASCQKPEAVLKLLEQLDGIEQWREEQFQVFKEKQDAQKLVKKPVMAIPKNSEKVFNQQNFETTEISNCQLIENSQTSFNSNTTGDSSVTGHMIRCFNDSTESCPIVSKTSAKNSMEKRSHKVGEANCDLPSTSSKKPVRPFLRKGTGLNRYFGPKSAKEVKTSNKNSPEQEICSVQVRQDKKPTKSHHNFVPSERNLKESSQRIYPPLKEQERTALNRDQNSEIHTSEQFKERHTIVADQIKFTGAESGKTNFKKPVSSVGDSSKLVVQFSEQTSIPLKIVSEVEEDNADNTESSPVLDNNDVCDNLNQSVTEFEILERAAQNSSFNSDSSVVQKVLRGEPLIPNRKIPDMAGLKQQYATTGSSFESPFSSLNLFKLRDEALAKRKKLESNQSMKEPLESIDAKGKQMESNDDRRKQMANNEVKGRKIESIHAIMSDNKQRIDHLQKEIESNNEVFLEDEILANERCSTPVNIPPHLSNPLSTNLDADVALNCLPADYSKQGGNHEDQNIGTKEASDVLLKDSFHLIENEDALCNKNSSANLHQNEMKEKMKQKIAQLQKEIETYQELNTRLEGMSKERDKISRRLKKEYDGIEKYKAEQKKKVDEEVEKERQQIKNERESFQRLKKSQKENFSCKERKELSTLRKENEKLLEELKRLKIKCTSDIERMKSQLLAAENARDEAQLKSITLEEHNEDLLNVLKIRMSKSKTSSSTESNKPDHIEDTLQNNNDHSSTVGCNSKNEKKDSTKRKVSADKTPHSNKSVKVNSSKPRVRFNLTPQFQTSNKDITSQEPEDTNKDQTSNEPDQSSNNEHENCAESKSKDKESNGSSISELSISELNFDGKKLVDKLLPSGEREIIYSSGTKKTIKIDGTIHILFHNGGTKYIFPNKHEIHKFENGVIEESFPDGSKVTEFPNGQVQYLMPDGILHIKFPDGISHVIHPDGYEYIEGTVDGRKTVIKPDGTSVLYCENGDTEIRTSTYKKREYADGSMRAVYINGRRETRYSNGRIKIKDIDGKVIMDTKYMTRKQAWSNSF